MLLTFDNKKGMGTSEPGTTSGWFIFDYKDIHIINTLPELFTVSINGDEYNTTINKDNKNPIVIDTNNGTHRFKKSEASEELDNVVEAMIKLDIFIGDTISGLIRTEQITLDN